SDAPRGVVDQSEWRYRSRRDTENFLEDLRPPEGKPRRTTLLLDCVKVRSLIQRQNCQPDSSLFVLHEQILAVKSGNFAKPLPRIISGKHWRMLYRAIGNPKLIEIGIKRIEPGRHGIKTPNFYDPLIRVRTQRPSCKRRRVEALVTVDSCQI